MVKKLALEGVLADFANVDRLLSSRDETSDPIGFMQLSNRKKKLLSSINEIEATPELRASVALFFAGEPVIGSRGIRVDFAGKMIGLFQDLVSKQFASEEIGDIGLRGPVPLKQNSDLLMTDIARGSVGVVLEEADQNNVVTETQLKIVVDHVTDAIVAASSVDAEKFEELLENIDHRFLSTMSSMFTLLDDERATTRIVEGEKDVQLDSYAIKRAKDRTTSAHITEKESDDYMGKFFLLPAHKKFELVKQDGGGTIYGSVSSEFAKGRLEKLLDGGDVAGHNWRVKLRVRTVVRPNREPKHSYVLMSLVEKIPAQK